MADASKPRGISLGYVIYAQIAGVFGAISVAAFLTHFIPFDPRGIVSDLIGVWTMTVRPLVGWIFAHTLVAFAMWIFHWDLNIPTIVQDYVGVGIVLMFSYLRAQVIVAPPRPYPHGRPRNFSLNPFSFVAFLGWMVIAWPAVVSATLLTFVVSFFDRKRVFDDIGDGPFSPDSGPGEQAMLSLLALSPLIYLGLLFVVNYLLPP